MQRSVQMETARTLTPSKLATFELPQLRTHKAPARPSKAATALLTTSSGVLHTLVDQIIGQGMQPSYFPRKVSCKRKALEERALL